jgi:trk system potassium uptake protein
MKIIVAGTGKVGNLLSDQLTRDGHDLVVIDRNPGALEAVMEQYDVMSIEGNSASVDVLRTANIEDTELLIAATGEDETNLLTCLTARGLNPDITTIARVRSPEYMDTTEILGDQLGLSLTVNPEFQTAHEISNLLRYPGFLSREEFVNGLVDLVELYVSEDSPICNKPLNVLSEIARCQILVCVVVRQEDAIIPNGDFVFQEGDHIYVTASASNLSTLLHNLNIVTRKIRNVIITGGGRISYYLARRLEQDHINVKIIEQRKDRCEYLADHLRSATVILGDASKETMLKREHIEDADAFISMTGIDELNIITSLYASALHVPKIVTKLGRGENLSLIAKMPVGSVITPKILCGNVILRYVRAMQNGSDSAETLHSIAGGRAEAYEFIVNEYTLHCEEPLKKIAFKPNVLLATITRDRKIEFPTGDSYIQPGDRVIVISNGATPILQLNDIFEKEKREAEA